MAQTFFRAVDQWFLALRTPAGLMASLYLIVLCLHVCFPADALLAKSADTILGALLAFLYNANRPQEPKTPTNPPTP